MILSLNNLNARASTLEEMINRKTEILKTAPSGSLVLSSSRGKPQFFLKNDDIKGRRKYLGGMPNDLICALAQKDYDQRILRAAKNELATLNILIRKYSRGNMEDIWDNLAPQRQEMVTPIVLPDDQFISQWLGKPYDRLGFDNNAPEIYNTKGLRVRSKSEAGISDKYDSRSVPYRLEEPLKLEGFGTVYPDFKVLNVKYRKEFIHEHFGMMDDPGYVEANIAKLYAYLENGYVMGKNFILTTETRLHPFDPNDMDIIIDQLLV